MNNETNNIRNYSGMSSIRLRSGQVSTRNEEKSHKTFIAKLTLFYAVPYGGFLSKKRFEMT